MTIDELEAIQLRCCVKFQISGCLAQTFEQVLEDRQALLAEVFRLSAQNDALRAALDAQQQTDQAYGGVETVDMYADNARLRAWIQHALDLGERSHQVGTFEMHALTLGMVMGAMSNALEGRAAPAPADAAK